MGTVTRLQCRGRKKISFVWGIEVELVLVWGPKLTFFFAGVKIFLVFVCAHFEWVVQIDLISVWGIDLKLIPV